MKSIGGFEFPENSGEAVLWSPFTVTRPLHRRVLVHARTRVEGTWSAYIFPVPGMRHDDEVYLWETEGDKLPANIAKAMFADFADVPYSG